MQKENFILKVEELKDDPNALGGYLIDSAKNDAKAINYIYVYEELLHSDNWYLKKVGLYALLFTFKLKDEKFTNSAISFLNNFSEDDEVRRWSARGLSVVYQDTKDKRVLKVLYEILLNENDNSFVRISCLESILNLLGLRQVDIYSRMKSVKIIEEDNDFPTNEIRMEFKKELEEVNNVLKG